MDQKAVQNALNTIREIKGSHTFYDIHVHPFEVMFDACQYRHSPGYDGLYCSSSSTYKAPEITEVNLHQDLAKPGETLDPKYRAMACLLNARRFYSHTGPVVFADQMALCGIDKVLLLPVMAENESGEAQMNAMCRMFGQSDKFMTAYSVPNDIPNDDVDAQMGRIVAKYNVRALKIHPSVTGIDLGCQKGIDRVESLLAAANNNGLKVVIHGGKSPNCKNSQAISYGIIQNLRNIDWSIISEPVIIAHGGCFGYGYEEAKETIVPILLNLFESHDHLSFDTSAIGIELLSHLFERFDSKRILFGSDALYEKQWISILKLWCGLTLSNKKLEKSLLDILCLNAIKIFEVKKVMSI
ncbi:amidohydrolase [Desulfuromonas sp. KJ2020]|uniref:amidohydrolase family protein n=1 Tax=Desulfuromonas sp. KJ2020 TaxID=2919173 RepID=UPI0020A7EDE7|nr:amidohydrolase family protein [Desulfuromonas sp. KJ2020]MCP3178144.1 amidohydrolase [Desulfuromonas sp. KJ2020]